MSTNGAYLSTGAIARLCRVAPATVGKWANKGILPCWRIPGTKTRHRRYHVDDVIAFLRTNGMNREAALVESGEWDRKAVRG